MQKGIRLIKRLVALILVLLLSIESFAAVVSDNDGSAFITKAEFDSLKNNFQSQIDQYNTSIDSKIDGAIASYLAGVKIEIETYISMIDNVRHFTDINNVTTSNPRVDVTFCISNVDNSKNADSNWTMGYEGSAKINTMGTTGEGVVAECVNTTKKI